MYVVRSTYMYGVRTSCIPSPYLAQPCKGCAYLVRASYVVRCEYVYEQLLRNCEVCVGTYAHSTAKLCVYADVCARKEELVELSPHQKNTPYGGKFSEKIPPMGVASWKKYPLWGYFGLSFAEKIPPMSS